MLKEYYKGVELSIDGIADYFKLQYEDVAKTFNDVVLKFYLSEVEIKDMLKMVIEYYHSLFGTKWDSEYGFKYNGIEWSTDSELARKLEISDTQLESLTKNNITKENIIDFYLFNKHINNMFKYEIMIDMVSDFFEVNPNKHNVAIDLFECAAITNEFTDAYPRNNIGMFNKVNNDFCTYLKDHPEMEARELFDLIIKGSPDKMHDAKSTDIDEGIKYILDRGVSEKEIEQMRKNLGNKFDETIRNTVRFLRSHPNSGGSLNSILADVMKSLLDEGIDLSKSQTYRPYNNRDIKELTVYEISRSLDLDKDLLTEYLATHEVGIGDIIDFVFDVIKPSMEDK